MPFSLYKKKEETRITTVSSTTDHEAMLIRNDSISNYLAFNCMKMSSF